MLHRFSVTIRQIKAAILAGTGVSIAITITASGNTSFAAFLLTLVGLCALARIGEAETRQKVWEKRKEEERRSDELFLWQLERDEAQMSRYAAELQDMPEAQRIVAVHQAMEAWKALGRPSSDLI